MAECWAYHTSERAAEDSGRTPRKYSGPVWRGTLTHQRRASPRRFSPQRSSTSFMDSRAVSNQLDSRALADWYPYWWRDSNRTHSAHWACEAFNALAPERRVIDSAAVLSLLSFEYICLDRTLVRGLSRSPWLGGVAEDGTEYFYQAPPHGDRVASPNIIAEELWQALRRELGTACRTATRVYVLLSGGMDSRVVAAVVRSLQEDGIISAPVQAVTWGVEGCRDVVYAERMADALGWPWTHVLLDANSYWHNFEVAVEYLGGEIDPKHLHRMTWFESAPPGSVVVAASYGDSIGRAEYSSVHLSRVTGLRPRDRYRLMLPHVRFAAEAELRRDVLALRGRHGTRSLRGYLELERQAHYMRRELCHPMCIINRWARVVQAFCSPEVFGLMWSFRIACRNDAVYRELLVRFASDLVKIPWSRTGQPYTGAAGPVSVELPRSFHRYGDWLRTEYGDRIERTVLAGRLAELNLFDMDQVNFMVKEWRREASRDDTTLATQVSSLAVIARLCERFGVLPHHAQDATKTGASGWQRAWYPAEKHVARALQVAARTTRPWRVSSC